MSSPLALFAALARTIVVLRRRLLLLLLWLRLRELHLRRHTLLHLWSLDLRLHLLARCDWCVIHLRCALLLLLRQGYLATRIARLAA